MLSFTTIVLSLLGILAGVFFSLPKKSATDQIEDAPAVPTVSPAAQKCVLVCGAGMIGSSFSAVYLARGMKVLCVDPHVTQEILEKRIREIWPHLVARKMVTDKDPPFKSLSKFDTIQDAMNETGKSISFVQECTWENVDFKQKVLSELDTLIDPSILIASSTSFITWPLLTADCKHKYRIMIGHPAIPHSHSFMEIYGAAEDWVAHCKEWYSQAGFDVLVMFKTVPGHVFNSFLRVNISHGTSLVAKGVCSVEDVNKAMRHFGRDLYARHAFISLLCGIGGDRGVEGGKELSKRIQSDAIYLVLFSGMKERGVPDFIAGPVGKNLGRLIVSLLPKAPEAYLRACEQAEEEITDGGKIPVQTAMFRAGSRVYDMIPMEVGNDPFARPKSNA